MNKNWDEAIETIIYSNSIEITSKAVTQLRDAIAKVEQERDGFKHSYDLLFAASELNRISASELWSKNQQLEADLRAANEDASALNIVAKDALLNCKCVMPESYKAVIENHRARVNGGGNG
jgi:hypothetical protein